MRFCSVKNKTKKDILWAVIQKMLFIPYKWGGDDPMGGFDCSGGIQEILDSVGIDPIGDQTADMLMKHFSISDMGEEITSIEFGDLVFFGRGEKATHIGISVSQTIMFEFGGGGSKTIDKETAEKHNAYGRFRRIRGRNDFKKAIRLIDLQS